MWAFLVGLACGVAYEIAVSQDPELEELEKQYLKLTIEIMELELKE